MLQQALILTENQETRRKDLTKITPNSMFPVDGKPFLEYLIWNLSRHGIKKIVLAAGHLYGGIKEYFSDGSPFDVQITYSLETTPMGTGGSLKLAEALLEDQFIVLDGDAIFDINYLDLFLHLKNGFDGVLALRKNEGSSHYGKIMLEDKHIITVNKKSDARFGAVSSGIYVLKKRCWIFSRQESVTLKPIFSREWLISAF